MPEGKRTYGWLGLPRSYEYERVNVPAQSLESNETVREILGAVTPEQLVAVALQWDGLTAQEAADLLGISRSAVSLRLMNARFRIARNVPSMMGDVLMRKKALARYNKPAVFCGDCGILISKKATWCRQCGPSHR